MSRRPMSMARSCRLRHHPPASGRAFGARHTSTTCTASAVLRDTHHAVRPWASPQRAASEDSVENRCERSQSSVRTRYYGGRSREHPSNPARRPCRDRSRGAGGAGQAPVVRLVRRAPRALRVHRDLRARPPHGRRGRVPRRRPRPHAGARRLGGALSGRQLRLQLPLGGRRRAA